MARRLVGWWMMEEKDRKNGSLLTAEVVEHRAERLRMVGRVVGAGHFFLAAGLCRDPPNPFISNGILWPACLEAFQECQKHYML